MDDELNNLISSLSEDNFKTLVKEYLKEKYKTPHVRIIDGPYDGGNDIEILIGEKEIKKNIQITVQKQGFETKLEKDIIKAKENIEKYYYQKNLDFYISKNVSKEKRTELEVHAETEYGITLKIFDGNFFAQEAQQFESIRDIAYKSHKINTVESIAIFDKQTKILYDVLTLDKNTVEIKKNFINSYIYSFLFTQPNSTIEEILQNINPHLNNTLDKYYLDKELNRLRGKQFLTSGVDKTRFNLSEEKSKEINQIFLNTVSQEESLKLMLETFISQHGINYTCKELMLILYSLYEENYKIDIEEVKSTNNSFSASIKKSYNDLVSHFEKKEVGHDKAKELAKELLKKCNDNDYLNKLSSIYLFTNLYASNKLEKYLNNKVQEIILDTQILIRILCILYNDKIDNNDTALQSVKILLFTFEKYKHKINLISSFDYVGEVAGHIVEALKLQRFTQFLFISKLGNSKNVFYNFYKELKENEVIDPEVTIGEFINEILGEEHDIDYTDDRLFQTLCKKLSQIYQLMNIELIHHETYPNYAAIKREYEIALSFESKNRTYSARENDLRTILYLATKKYHTNPESGEITEPFLITWDSFFYIFRKKLQESHDGFSYWYIYSPLKVVDRFSVMNFNLNPKSINLNIISLAETNFNYSTKTYSFMDVISSFFNEKDLTKMEIIHKLANLKNGSENIDEVPKSEELKSSDDNQLIHLLLNLRSHYHSPENKYKFSDIISVFELPRFEDEIIKILEFTMKPSLTTESLKTMYDSFDLLIETNKGTSA